jgi:hypothetical protein
MIIGPDSIQVGAGSVTTPSITIASQAVCSVTTSSSAIKLSVTSMNILKTLELRMTGTSLRLLIDRTWYDVVNAADLRVVLLAKGARLVVESELYTVPILTVVDGDNNPVDWESEAHSPEYSSGLAFYVFIGLFSVVVIASLVLIFVG